MRKSLGMAALALAVATSAGAAGRPITRDEAFKLMARPGSWLDTDGTPMPDGTFQVKDIEVFASTDTLDIGTPSIDGVVGNLNRAKSTMRVLNYNITWDEKTTFKDENKRKILSSKVDEGAPVKVQGQLQPDGSIKASKIKLNVTKDKGTKTKPKTKIFAPVTIQDAKTGRLRLLNTTVTIRDGANFIEHMNVPQQQTSAH